MTGGAAEQAEDGFGGVYATFWAPATGLARRLTRDATTAEDIAAEGLVRVWRQWEAGRVCQPWGYVRKTIVNETISRERRAVRERAALSRYRPAQGRDHEDTVADRDLIGRLLAKLPPRQRRLLELRFLEDLSERETALRLGISVGAVKSGTSRALARLRTSSGADSVAA